MKRPLPDIGDQLRTEFISNIGHMRKFKRLWGTEIIDGVEVLTHRQYYHPVSMRSANYEKLMRFLGVYDQLEEASTKGLKRAWLYLNRSNGSTLPSADPLNPLQEQKEFVADNLNKVWWDTVNDGPMPGGISITTTVAIEALIENTRADDAATTPLLDTSWTDAQIQTAIETNFDTLWATCHISQQGEAVINKGTVAGPTPQTVVPDEDRLSASDVWMQTLSRYTMKSTGLSYTIEDINIGYGETESGWLYPIYLVDINIPYQAVTASSPIVNDIVNDINGVYTSFDQRKLTFVNGFWTQKDLQALQAFDEEDEGVVTNIIPGRAYRLWEDEAVDNLATTSSLWHTTSYSSPIDARTGGPKQYHYLKADVFDNPRSYNLTFRQLNEYLSNLLDSGYKKKSGLLKKIIGAIVFVVAVVLAAPTGGGSLYAYAAAVGVGALVLTLSMLVFMIAGLDSWAMAFSSVMKALEPLIIAATVVTFYQSATRAIQKAAQKVGEQGLAQTIVQSIKNVVTDIVDDIIKGASDLFSGTISSVSINFIRETVRLVSLPFKLKLKQLNERNKDLKAEYDDLMKESDQEDNVLLGMMSIYSRPATADWSMFAAEFDMPYERSGGGLHIGNIQRTTKKALRPADYNERVFDDIMII